MTQHIASISQQAATLARTSPAVLYRELCSAPELGVFTATVTRFVERQQAEVIASGITPRAYTGITPLTIVLDTLLKALAWQAVDAIGCRRPDAAMLLALRDGVIGSATAKGLGRQLHTALGWDEYLAGKQPDPVLLRQLVWCALLLELEPPEMRRPVWIAGYDLCAARNWSLGPAQLRSELIEYLQWRTRDIENNRCESMACLALCLLEPLHPQLALIEEAQHLHCGTLAWAEFMHGVTLAEALRPGSAAKMSAGQLTKLPMEVGEEADADVQQFVAQARVPAALQWAVAHGKVAHRLDGRYSSEHMQEAVGALNEYARQTVDSLQALLAAPPDRKFMAEQKFRELFGVTAHLMGYLRMYPTSLGKRLEYALRNPAPSVPAGEFLLLDLFAAGNMKNGRDLFEFSPDKEQKPIKEMLLAQIDRLKGIDLPALFDQAFDTWYRQVRRSYAFIIESLLEQIPRADQVALARGRVQVFVLRAETRMAVDRESEEDRLLKQGRFGFILQCIDNERSFSYEVFPLSCKLVRRSDLPPLPTRIPEKREYAYFIQGETSVAIDWTAYWKGSTPRSGHNSMCIPVQCAVFEPQPDTPLPDTLGLTQLRAIAQAAAHHNLFFHRQSLYAQQRRVAWVERVERNYPPVLYLIEVLVPGLACLNAVQTNNAPTVTCTLEIVSLLAQPLMKLASGALKIGVAAGRLVVNTALPAYGQTVAFARELSGVVAVRVASRIGSLPRGAGLFRWPQRVNGRLGYPLGGEGAIVAARTGGLGRKIDDVAQFDEFVKGNDIFAGRRQIQLDMRAEVEVGADIRVYVRRDGSRTLVRQDSTDKSYIDLADNTRVTVDPEYDFRIIKTWKVIDHDAAEAVVQLPLQNVYSAPTVLDSKRLSGIREAIKNGTPLPAIQVHEHAQGYRVINGNHRLQVAQELMLETVPARIHTPASEMRVEPVVEAVLEPIGKSKL